jgi:hypothetical protein
MPYFRNLILFTLSLFFVFSHPAKAVEDDYEEISTLLQINEEDSYVVYGEYAEIEITSRKAVRLNLENSVKPFGLELEKVDNKTYILFGRSEFIGKLCFYVDARINSGQTTKERLCLYASDNEEIAYPRIEKERFLEPVSVGAYLNLSFDLLEYEVDVTQSIIGLDGLSLSSSRNYQGIVSLSGQVYSPGLYSFIVKTIETGSEVVTYKQYVLEVYESVNNDDSTTYQCAPGYYWDSYLKYCVQASGRTCGTGTWYDVESNTCVAYRTVRTCGYGRYFDHWLNRCVRVAAMRCPLNYEWDNYYSRCVRLPYTCSYGERYNYSLRRCIPIYRTRVCGIGYRWSSFKLRCVRTHRVCRIGDYWNGYNCVRTSRVCSSNRYYDPVRGRCLSRTTIRTCRPGHRWDYSGSRCVRRRVIANRTCVRGTRWSNSSRSCVRHIDRRVRRHERPVHRRVTRPRPQRPGPVTRPGDRPRRDPQTRPGDRPRRDPQTRPGDRPRRDPQTRPTPNRPSRPTTRPDRPRRDPQTRPAPSRPSRPTTRPDRPRRDPQTRPAPNRPSRPTTRPDRPRRDPQTRPAPSRPSRPTTRPDRPRRDSGSSTSRDRNRDERRDRARDRARDRNRR